MKKEEIIDLLNSSYKDEVIPHEFIDEGYCNVYKPNGEFLCKCNHELMFLDICCQIARNHLAGYYAVKNDVVYKIMTDGRVDVPKGKKPLFDVYNKYMKFLMGF